MSILYKTIKSIGSNVIYTAVDKCVTDHAIERNRVLYNKHKGQTCVILGSGSSIQLYNLRNLNHVHVITQNNFHVHPQINLIKPAYHCVVPYYQTTKEKAVWHDWLKDMYIKLPSDTVMVFGKNTKSIVEKVFDDTSRVFYIKSKYRVLTLSNPHVDMTKTIMEVSTAFTQCLITAMYLGFKEIYLLGCDFDQIISSSKSDYNRFYGKSMITDTSYETSNELKYIGAAQESAWFHRWLIIKQLNLLHQYATENQISIYNGSNEGILDVFPRRHLGYEIENL